MIPGTNIASKLFRGQFTYAGFDPKKFDEHFDRSPSRRSTVKVADRIVVMAKGSMIEEGNHNGLLERGVITPRYTTHISGIKVWLTLKKKESYR